MLSDDTKSFSHLEQLNDYLATSDCLCSLEVFYVALCVVSKCALHN